MKCVRFKKVKGVKRCAKFKGRGPHRTTKVGSHQIGRTHRAPDRVRKAMKPGKRLSRKGKVYYEYRRNRSDVGKYL